MRRIVTLAIICFWLSMLVALGQRTWLAGGWSATDRTAPSARGDGPSGTAAPVEGEQWLGVYHHAHKIGYAYQRIERTVDGFAFAERSVLRLSVLDTPQTVQTEVRGHTGNDFGLRDVDFELQSGAGTLHASGTVEGTTLHLTVRTGVDVSERSLPLKEPIYFGSTLRNALGHGHLEAGKRFDAMVFDPTTLSNDRITVVVEAQEAVPAAAAGLRGWRIREESRGIRTTAWITDDGAVLREEGPMGLTLVQETAAAALNQGWDDGAPLDVAAEVAVPVAGPIDNPRSRRSLRLRLSGVSSAAVPSDDQQTWDGEVLAIKRPDVEAVGSYQLPYHGDEVIDFVQPTALLQSTHPRIQALARDILGRTTDAKDAARQLNDWVHGHLRQVPTMSLPNALQVLDMGQGDCNEHAVLLAALARAVGLPTRVVAGAVYVEGAFLYHAWCEVWLGRWVSIDPALHQFPADATHIKFVAGDPEEQMAMMEVIGHLTIEVLPDVAEKTS